MTDTPSIVTAAIVSEPQTMVEQLDRFVVGQFAAKKKVVLAWRQRALRQYVQGPIRNEITPKNILMVGPTGVGKTEIIRRLATLLQAPFIKVEATKFTEVGYVGRDVESIIRDLADRAVKEFKERALKEVAAAAEKQALERVLDTILAEYADLKELGLPTQRDELREEVLKGHCDELQLNVEVSQSIIDVEIMAPPGMEEMTSQLHQVFQSLSSDRKKKREISLLEALKAFKEEESVKLLDEDALKEQALKAVEEQGIVFIDEIDKVCQRSQHSSDVSREGVQRDLLPLIEGCSVSTRYGTVHTDHILFITSGAFQLCKPSDLIPELQGRLPIRVELDSLTVEDFVAILSSTDASLIAQYQALLNVDGTMISFENSAIKRVAEIAFEINERLENIGARRLHTVMDRLLEDLFFDKAYRGQNVVIDEAFVNTKLGGLLQSEDLFQYVL